MELTQKKEQFVNKIKTLYPNNFGEVLKNIENPKPVTFRINTLLFPAKDTVEKTQQILDTLTSLGFEIEQGPLINSYIVKTSPSNLRLSETKAFETGQIYIQNLSSMLPVEALGPKPTDKVLDLCAAPGSKTLQIAQATQNLAQITAVENNRNRFFALQKNLESHGAKNFTLLMENAQYLTNRHPDFIESFDKVLVDAPCSNEGQVVLNDIKSLARWNPKTPKHLAKLQKKLIAEGAKLLKKDGTLVYSTCTFSKEENEDVVSWVLTKFPNLKLIEQSRVLPNNNFTGFFLAKLVKSA